MSDLQKLRACRRQVAMRRYLSATMANWALSRFKQE